MRTNSFGRLSARGLGQWMGTSDWTLVHTISSSNALAPIAYGDGYFVLPSADLSGDVYRSTDGTSWSTTTMSTVIRPRVFDYGNGYFLGLGVYTPYNTQMTSGDAGASWSYANTSVASFLATDGAGVWMGAAASYTYDVSLDNGSTWTSYSTPTGYKFWQPVHQGGTWTFTAVDNAGASFTFLSTDNGATWSSPYSQTWGTPYLGQLRSNGSYIIGPKDTGTPGSSNLVKSTDNGVTWSDVSTPYRFTGLCIDGSTILAVGDAKSYLSKDDGSTWTELENDPLTTFGGYLRVATNGSGLFLAVVWDPAGYNYILRYKI